MGSHGREGDNDNLSSDAKDEGEWKHYLYKGELSGQGKLAGGKEVAFNHKHSRCLE